MDSYVAALKEEREGYVRRGLHDRVKQVDALLAAFEPKPAPAARESAAVQVEAETAVVKAAKRRKV